MCANYEPADKGDREQLEFPWSVADDLDDFHEVYPGKSAAILTNALRNEWIPAMFGLVPHWGDPAKLSRSTYNSRSETADSKPSFRSAWKQRQLALVPIVRFFEPYYETPTSKPVRWAIERADGAPFCAAALWERRMGDSGPAHWSFSLLTVNADGHAVMGRMHKHGDEKRTIVLLDACDYEGWLSARTDAEIRSYLRPFEPDGFVCRPAPAAVRTKA